MILRRIIAHFRKQEWTAIGIDFVIVVVGVFVATQVSDWNNARFERAEYLRAVERLDAEISANLEIIDGTLPEVITALDNANRALDALQTCADSAANEAAVNAGLEAIRGTNGLPLRRRALTDLTTSPTLLAQQSADERQVFSDLLDYLLLFEQEMRFSELHPLAERVEDNPLIRIGPSRTVTFTYAGVEYTRIGASHASRRSGQPRLRRRSLDQIFLHLDALAIQRAGHGWARARATRGDASLLGGEALAHDPPPHHRGALQNERVRKRPAQRSVFGDYAAIGENHGDGQERVS